MSEDLTRPEGPCFPWARISPPPLESGMAHVWVGRMVDPWPREVLNGWLSKDERARARRFRFEKDRERFTLGRGMLRALLGRYLETAPETLNIQASAAGKPFSDVARSAGIAFNSSRSHDLAVCALFRGEEVGVDIEKIRYDLDLLGMAASVFSEGEVSALASLDPADQSLAFFNLWTQKEAAAKAEGIGLAADLSEIQHRFELTPLALPGGYVGHLATAEPVVEQVGLRLIPGPAEDLHTYGIGGHQGSTAGE